MNLPIKLKMFVFKYVVSKCLFEHKLGLSIIGCVNKGIAEIIHMYNLNYFDNLLFSISNLFRYNQ